MKSEKIDTHKDTVPLRLFHGALCFEAYCRKLGVSDPALDALVVHLKGLKDAECWPDWETELAELEIAGLGDPVPERILHQMDVKKRIEFERLLQCVVEIGVAGFYSADTGEAEAFLGEVKAKLIEVGVPVPAFDNAGGGDRL